VACNTKQLPHFSTENLTASDKWNGPALTSIAQRIFGRSTSAQRLPTRIILSGSTSYRVFVTFDASDLEIELMTGPWIEECPYQEETGWDHLAISLGSEVAVDAVAFRCRENGVVVSETRTPGDDFYEAVIAMPHDTRIEFTS